MDGARDIYNTINNAARNKLGGLLQTNQGTCGGNSKAYRWDNVIFVIYTHARGRCVLIYLVDDDESLFKVYGVTGGQPGWTETYGWLRKGTWVTPILRYLRALDREYTELVEQREELARAKQSEANREIGEKVAKFNEMFRERGDR